MHSATTASAAFPLQPERCGNVAYGIVGHLGAPGVYAVALAVGGVDLWYAIWSFVVVSIVFVTFVLIAERIQPDVELATPALSDWIDGLFMIFIKGAAIGGAFVTLGWYLLSAVPLWGPPSNAAWRIAAAVVLADLGYYVAHRLLSHGHWRNRLCAYYREKHGAHHSVTALDFLRGNQSSLVDTAFSQFQPALIIVSWVLGLDLAGTVIAYAMLLALQLTDHTNVTFNIGWLRFVFMDNHAHRFHHCRGGERVNFAAAFSIWDRAFGTYREDWSISSGALHRAQLAIPTVS